MTPEEWLDAQPDVIECPLGAKMTLRACKKRQLKRPLYSTEDGVETFYESTFLGCSKQKCKHFNSRPKRPEKLNRQQLKKIFCGHSDINFFNPHPRGNGNGKSAGSIK